MTHEELESRLAEIEKVWVEESEKRIDAFEYGKLKAYDWDDAKKI